MQKHVGAGFASSVLHAVCASCPALYGGLLEYRAEGGRGEVMENAGSKLFSAISS